MNTWMELFESVASCDRCQLSKARTFAVPGEGNPNARLMLVGEGPGADEDAQGRPFVGASGMLLTAMLHAIGLERTEVYIANVVKCRPPTNRTPTPDEALACMPYLQWQIARVKPKIIVALGATASKYIIGEDIRIRRDHGKWIEKGGILYMPTYHPSALLREPSQKKLAWEDFKAVRDYLKGLEA